MLDVFFLALQFFSQGSYLTFFHHPPGTIPKYNLSRPENERGPSRIYNLFFYIIIS